MAKRYLWVVERWSEKHGWMSSMLISHSRETARSEAKMLKQPRRCGVWATKVRVVRYSAEDK